MKLSYYCSSSSCKKENYLKTKTTNRHEFLMEYGKNELNERCNHCGNFTKRHINRLHAEPNKYIILGGVGTAVIATILLWDIGFISTLTFSIPIFIGASERKRTSAFNRTMVK